MKNIFNINTIKNYTNGVLLNPCNLGFQTIKTDSRENCSNALFIALKGEHFDGHKFIDKALENGAIAICVDNEYANTANFTTLSVPVLVVENTLKAYQQIANYHRNRLNVEIIGVTGSSGKTSTKEILKSIFQEFAGEGGVYATKANTNNHIGVPQNLLNLNENHKFAIIEMGTNHIGEIKTLSQIAEPNTAMITSIGHSHIENFGSVENIAEEKLSICDYIKNNGTCIIPDICIKYTLKYFSQNFLFFGKNKNSNVSMKYLGSNLNGSSFLFRKNNEEEYEIKWGLTGEHQAMNASGAILVSLLYQIPIDVIIKGCENAKLTGMRSQISYKNNITIINDAYNANPESMKSSLLWLAEFANINTTYIVLGDMLELGENSLNYHIKCLELVKNTFKQENIYTVGLKMREASQKVFGNINNNYLNVEEVTDFVNILNPQDTLFIKGSRGMKLEKILKKGIYEK